MYIDPIHAGPVALAHTLALATRARTQPEHSGHLESTDRRSRRHRFEPLRRLAQWFRKLDEGDGSTVDPVQLMMLYEPVGRPYATALSGLPLTEYIRRNRTAARRNRAEPQ